MSKPRQSQPGPPKRVPSAPVPPNARKASAPIQPGPSDVAEGSTGRSSPGPKFYVSAMLTCDTSCQVLTIRMDQPRPEPAVFPTIRKIWQRGQ